MITVTLNDSRGNRRMKVSLAFSKSDCGARILRQLQNADLAKSGGWTLADLTRLDAGTLAFSKAVSLYSPDEVETAIQGRLDDISGEGEELFALKELLHSGKWTGELLAGDAMSREALLRRGWKETVSGPRKSMDSEHDIRKFLPGLIAAAGGAMAGAAAGAGMETLGSIIGAGSALGSAVGAGWEASGGAPQGAGPDQVQPPVQKGRGQSATVELTHRRHPGHVLRINATGEETWGHYQGAKEIAASERDASPAVCVAHLRHHLTKFHGI